MTRSIFVILASVSLAACSLLAQSVTLRVTVSFDFAAGSSSFPAGQDPGQATDGPSQVVVRSAVAKRSAIVLSHGAQATNPAGNASLVFNAYRDRYFLSPVWTGDASLGQEIPAARVEREQMMVESRLKVQSP